MIIMLQGSVLIRQGLTEARPILSIAPNLLFPPLPPFLFIPYVGGVVALCPGEEGCLHDRLGVVGRDLPQAVVRLQATLGQLQVKVAPAGVHLQHLDLFEDGSWIFGSNLDRRLVRVVDVNDWRVAGVKRKLDTDQRLEKENEKRQHTG